MIYADPHACPACRGAISGEPRCPHCDFDLGSKQARQLWALFQEADRLVRDGRSAPRHSTTVPTAARATTAATAGSPVAARADLGIGTLRSSSVEPPRSWSTGSILLGLGAVCLVVAAIIFATVAWGSLGILGRALILLAVTGVVGAGAAWATRRRLFGAAEALWGVFLGLITVDVLAAVAEGLFGLDWSDFAVVSVAWTAVVLAAAVAIVRWARSRFEHDLVVPQLGAGLAVWISAPAVGFRVGDVLGRDELWFWAALVAFGVALVVVAVAHRTAMRWALWPSAVLVLGIGVVLVLAAIGALSSGDPVVTVLEALPALTLVAVAAAGAAVLDRLRPWLAGFAALAVMWVVGAVVNGWAWSAGWSTTLAWVVLAVIVAVLAVTARAGDGWALGLRWASVLAGSAVLLWASGVAVANLQRIDTAAWFASPASVWVRPAENEFVQGWWVLAVVAPILVAWWAARRWTSPTLVPASWWRPLAEIVAGATVITAVASTFLPFLLHAATLAVVGALLAVSLRRAPWFFALVPPVVVAFSMIVVPSEAAVTVWGWAMATAGLAVCAAVSPHAQERPRRAVSAVSAGLAAAAGIATVVQVADLMDLAPGWPETILVILAAASLLLSLALDELPWHRLAVEVVAGLAFLAGVLAESDDLATVALFCTIGAVAAAIVGLLDDDRPYLRWVAVGLVACAWVTRLAASEIETVEAYTAPFAVALLAAGAWRLRTDPGSRSWTALTPGLTMALLPSLPQALADPTSVRAALLGLVALAVLAAGVVLRWGAPVVAGAAVALLIVLANVGPTALGLQRWILIALAGVVLLVVGTTWEKRVAEGRALVARLAALR